MYIVTTNSETGSRSQVMAHAERLVEMGVKKVALLYMTEGSDVGMIITEDMSVVEAVYALRQVEHMILSSELEEDEDDTQA